MHGGGGGDDVMWRKGVLVNVINLKTDPLPAVWEKEKLLAILLRNETHKDIKGVLDEVEDTDLGLLEPERDKVVLGLPKLWKSKAKKSQIIVARSAKAVVDSKGDNKFTKSMLLILTTPTDDPISYAIVHAKGNVVYLDYIWKSLYGTVIIPNNGAYRGLSIIMLVTAVRNVFPEADFVFGKGVHEGSRMMFTNNQIYLYDDEDADDLECSYTTAFKSLYTEVGGKYWMHAENVRDLASSFMSRNKRVCDFCCENYSSYACGGCGEVTYCGRLCAQRDWVNRHEGECGGGKTLL